MLRVSRRTIKWMTILALSTVIVAGVAALVPRERLLSHDARRITAVDNGSRSTCLWRSDHSCILLRYHADGDRFEFVELDAATGIYKPMDWLNRKYRADLHSDTIYVLNRSETLAVRDMRHYRVVSPTSPQFLPRTVHRPPYFALSPKGKWLVFGPHLGKSRRTRDTIGAALDDGKELRWPSSGLYWDSFVYWYPPLPNRGERWLQRASGRDWPADVIIYDPNRPEWNKRVSNAGGLLTGDVLGVTFDAKTLQIDRTFAPDASARMTAYDLSSSAPTGHRYAIRLPILSRIGQVALSSRGDRLAWLLAYDDVAPLSRWLHQRLPGFPLRSKPAIGIWVSQVDGRGMKEVGHTAAHPKAQPEQEITSLQWLPGDKKVSFLFNSGLYTINVP